MKLEPGTQMITILRHESRIWNSNSKIDEIYRPFCFLDSFWFKYHLARDNSYTSERNLYFRGNAFGVHLISAVSDTIATICLFTYIILSVGQDI